MDRIGDAWNALSGALTGAVVGAVAVAASFLSSSWGGIRFAAVAAWNGIGWSGSQLASGAQKAWKVYNDDLNLGILPDKRVPFGLPQSIVLGFLQWRGPEARALVRAASERRSPNATATTGHFEGTSR